MQCLHPFKDIIVTYSSNEFQESRLVKMSEKINAIIKYGVIMKNFISYGANAFVAAKPSQPHGFIVAISRG